MAKPWDGIFSAKEVDVVIPAAGGTVYIEPFGDVHHDNKSCCKETWGEFLEDAYNRMGPTTLFLGMGDYIDMASSSERKGLAAAGLHDTTMDNLDIIANQNINAFIEDISFMQGKLLGFIQGNHDWVFEGGPYEADKTGSQVMAEDLGTEWLGVSSRITVNVKLRSGKLVDKIKIYANHGKGGGGSTVGAPFNTVQKMSMTFGDGELFLMGHDHSLGGLPSTVLSSRGDDDVGALRCYYGRTGSFLRAYEPNVQSYVTAGGYKPATLGVIRYEYKFTKRVIDGAISYKKKVNQIS